MAGDKEKSEAEAIRLKILAEQKYTAGNLKSALKYAKRAHRLHPTADGVSEMLTAFKILNTATIAAVGDGATATASPLPDYYKILQLERFSHINTVKKQYKKLALTLHPDKNPYVASEEAFKLVGEAVRVLSDKIRRKEYDVKLRIAMQSAVLDEESETTTFWTACSTCRLLHQFDRKYLGHNLMCPSCKESFEAIEVSEEDGGEDVVDRTTRVSARIKTRRKNGNFRFSRNGELGGKRKMRSVDEIGAGSEVVRPKREVKVRNEEMKGDVDSDDCLIEGLRSRSKGKVRNVSEEEEEVMTLAEMQMLLKKKANKEKVAVKERGEENENEEAMKVNATEQESEKRNLSLVEEEDEPEMEMLIARVREKRMNKEKVAVKDKGEEKEKNEKVMNVDVTEKESEEGKETDLSLIEEEEEEEAEVESLIARVREKRANKEKVAVKEKGGEKEDNEKVMNVDVTEKESEEGKETELSLIEEEEEDEDEEEAEVESLIARVREKRANKEKVAVKEKGGEKEDNEKGMKFNSTEKESEEGKEIDLSLIEEDDEAEVASLIARVREKRANKEKVAVQEKGGEKEDNEKAVKFNSTEKESEEGIETDLSLIEEEEEYEAEMESLIGKVSEKRANKEKVVVKEKGGEKEDNEKAMKFNSTEKGSEKRKETDLSLIGEEDEAGMGTLIARVREKRVRREALKGDGMEVRGRRRDLSSKRSGKRSREDDLEIIAAKSFDLYNFDNDRVERSFKKGQVWAICDADGMPRDYALIDDVISVHPFEVRLNRLEFQSNSDEALVHWGRMGFHISCGKFKVSRQALVKSLKKFSHIVNCERAARELYRIYPTKGSIWALFKESDLGAGGRKLCYDIVVSLSSYTDMHGVSIAYLKKVDGFRTIFKRRDIGAHAIRLLGKDDLGLFSHRIPARKLSDEEASSIAKDCWELDPASLPHNC